MILYLKNNKSIVNPRVRLIICLYCTRPRLEDGVVWCGYIGGKILCRHWRPKYELIY